MTIQQLLDSHENQEYLAKSLKSYCGQFSVMLDSVKNTTMLTKQPLFSWSVNGESIQTSCWLLEGILPNVALYGLYVEQAVAKANGDDFKTANKLFVQAEAVADTALEMAARWTWKIPAMNHEVVRTRWHLAQKYMAKTYQNLCFIGLGLQNDTNSKTMKTLSDRAFANASKAYANWPQELSQKHIQIADGLRHLFNSNVQWDKGAYGVSIHTLQSYFTEMPTTFDLLNKEFEKIPFLLQERITTNNGAYFDPVQPCTLKLTTEQIINSV